MTLDRELSEAVERALFAATNDGDPHMHARERARVLDDLVQLVYDHIKKWVPGGGLDGHDSDERASIGEVLGAAHDHLHRQLVANAPDEPSNVTLLRPNQDDGRRR